MELTLTYDLSAHRLLTEPELRASLGSMKRAGVRELYLFGYFYGRFESTLEELERARILLEGEGFEVGVINLPIGHGGNALNPNDPTVDLTIGESWSTRVDRYGCRIPTTTCINDKMISDSLEANLRLRDAGFVRLMNDDDLRLARWGAEIQGCFCDDCMADFSARIGQTVKREDIFKDGELADAWVDYQCEKIPRFLRETTPDGMVNGVMVMHNGDRRHGIDIQSIVAAMPEGSRMRVGEGHFSDDAFLHPLAKSSLEASIHTHLSRIGNDELVYSESTVYPAAALSPENLVKKLELEIDCGLKRLYLMSGTWFLSEPYFAAIEAALPSLRERAARVGEVKHEVREFIWQI